MDTNIETAFLQIMKEEMIPAMGCTEPIALAYASALARKELGEDPTSIVAKCSGNMIKNVRCVFIPNSHGLTGIETACAMGAFGGDSNKNMEVLATVLEDKLALAKQFVELGKCKVEYLNSDIPLHFIIVLKRGDQSVSVEIRHDHTNVYQILKNDKVIYFNDQMKESEESDRSQLNLRNIKTFADEVDLEKVKPLISRQIEYNMAIAKEGMKGNYGVGIGPLILDQYEDDIFHKMRAYASAASEARMGGCDLPVIINSGSGNQGISSSVPLIVYAQNKGIDEETLYRSLVFSALLTIYQKEYIGKLSAFCGAISATCSSGAALTYMLGGTLDQIDQTIDSTLAITPGIICDGAKISCAAKINSGLEASLLAHRMVMNGKHYLPDTGIIRTLTDETVTTVGEIGREGMKYTDKVIIASMLKK